MNTITKLTLGEAARHCGVAKATISKAISTGKLSATRREDASWAIDASELARYLEANGHRFRPETRTADQPVTAADQAATPADHPVTLAIERTRADLAEQRLADLREMLADMRGQRDDARGERDAWREQAQRLALPVPSAPRSGPILGWWTRLKSARRN